MKTRTTKSLSQQTLAIVLSLAMFAVPVLAQGSKGPVKTDTKINYHDGPVMQGQSNLYLIWYGNWNTLNDSYTKIIVNDFAANLGGSEHFQINAGYPDANGISPSGSLIASGSASDSYSQGATPI